MIKKTEANVNSPLPDREGRGSGVAFPSYYLAPISYYAHLLRCDVCSIDTSEIYRKQTLRNRCYIASPNGPLALTIPVVKFVPCHTPMHDIRISDHGNWRHLHWNALQSSYGRTPFFEFYADDFAPFYEKKWEFLVDYNQALQEKVCELIGMNSLPHSLTPSLHPSSFTFDLWPTSLATRDNSNEFGSPLAAQKVHPSPFTLHPSPITHNPSPFTFHPYYQLFSDRHGFMPDLSIVDLLFNMGPESILYLNNLQS